jgi:hypothetical protein
MSDIFISYTREDRSRIEPIAKALEEQGWSVWWDRKIPPGKTFSQVIEEAIDVAKCVIVIWSHGSIKSDWVQNEAAEGARRKILVPALIDDVKIPFEFRRIQAADLIEWESQTDHPGFTALLSTISEIVGHSSLKVNEKEQKREEAKLNADRKKLKVLMHRAYFEDSIKPCFFIKVTNLFKEHDIEITHVWMETNPRVHIVIPERPLPVRLKPFETWETWTEEVSIPEQSRNYPYDLGRVRISTGQTFQSNENKDVPDRGYVAGRRDR